MSALPATQTRKKNVPHWMGYLFCGKDSRKKHLPVMARNVFALNEGVKF
jgi:hypothetical protein